MKLTEKQRHFLARAEEEGGRIVCMNRSDTMVAKACTEMGLGEHDGIAVFEINERGRSEIGVGPTKSAAGART